MNFVDLKIPYSLLLVLFLVLADGELLPQIFVKMLQRDKPIEMQLTSAKMVKVKYGVGERHSFACSLWGEREHFTCLPWTA